MEPPGPSSWIPGRLALPFIRNRLTFLRRLTAQYGDVVFFRISGTPFAILNHPDMVRDVLVTRHRQFHKGIGLERARMLLGDGLLTSEDDRHRRQRRLMQPAFHRERIDGYAETMVHYADRRQRAWRDGHSIDVAREMGAITLAIAGKTLFDADIEREHADVGDALAAALTSFNLGMLPFGDRLVRLPIPAARRFRRGRAALDAIVYRLIAERRAGRGSGHDLLSMLIAATDDDGDGSGMTDDQLRDEAVTLLLAGHETTANALAWTWHLLASSPEIERRLHAEVDGVLAQRFATADDLSRLPFTRAVLAEALRLFPPAYLLGRRALSAYTVPGTEYELPPRTVVFLSQYLLHRDPRFWDEPDAFRPERWLETAGAPNRHRFAYFPFGAGPRVCIGEQFAWMEGVLVLATLARRWTFRPVAGHVATMQPIVTLRPRGGLPMVPAVRDGSPPPDAAARPAGRPGAIIGARFYTFLLICLFFAMGFSVTGRSLTGVATIVFLAAAGVGAVDKWDKRPYNTWTDLELKEVLTGSPWAGGASITRVSSNGASSGPLEEIALISWASGLPLRQAGVREQVKVNTPIPAEVDTALAKSPEMYVITMKVTGGQGSSYAGQAAAIQAETSLVREGKPPLKATAAEGRILDKNGKTVQSPAGGFGPGRGGGRPGGGAPGAPPGGAPGGGAPGGGGFEVPSGGGGAPPSQSVQQSVPGVGRAQAPALAPQGGGGGGGGRGGGGGFGGGGGGAGGGVASLLIFAFPKTEAITLADKEVEFVSKLCGGGGFGGGGGGARGGGGTTSPCNLNVKKKFKLKDMQYMGELAL